MSCENPLRILFTPYPIHSDLGAILPLFDLTLIPELRSVLPSMVGTSGKLNGTNDETFWTEPRPRPARVVTALNAEDALDRCRAHEDVVLVACDAALYGEQTAGGAAAQGSPKGEHGVD